MTLSIVTKSTNTPAQTARKVAINTIFDGRFGCIIETDLAFPACRGRIGRRHVSAKSYRHSAGERATGTNLVAESPTVKQMNEEAKKELEIEGK